MLKSCLKTTSHYLSKLNHTFLEVRELTKSKATMGYIYKIIDKKIDKNTGEEKFVIQVAGKSAFMLASPQELVKDDNTLRGFSPLDIRTITYFSCKSIKSIYKVADQILNRNSKKAIVVLQNDLKDEIVTQSVEKISQDKDLVNKLSPADAHLIGYIAGAESITNEKNAIKCG